MRPPYRGKGATLAAAAQGLRARAGLAWCAVAGLLLLLTTLGGAPAHAQAAGICGRTAQVQTAILDEIAGVSACGDVTSTQLAAIDLVDLSDAGITALAAGDFAGLTALEDLYLDDSDLTELPAGVFAGLTALEELELDDNDLTELPAGVFAGLTAVTDLYVSGNLLTTLPAGVFAGLTALEELELHHNRLTTLPDGVFAGLTAVNRLTLANNPGAPFAPAPVALPDEGRVSIEGARRHSASPAAAGYGA